MELASAPSGEREGAVAPSPAAEGQLAGPPLEMSAAKPLHELDRTERASEASERVREKTQS